MVLEKAGTSTPARAKSNYVRKMKAWVTDIFAQLPLVGASRIAHLNRNEQRLSPRIYAEPPAQSVAPERGASDVRHRRQSYTELRENNVASFPAEVIN